MPQLNSLIILLMSLAASASLFGVCVLGARQFAPKENYKLDIECIAAKHHDTILYNSEAPTVSSNNKRWDEFKKQYEDTKVLDKQDKWLNWSVEVVSKIKSDLLAELPQRNAANTRRSVLEKLDLKKQYSLNPIPRDVLNLRPSDEKITVSIDGKDCEFRCVDDKQLWFSTEEFPEDKWPLPGGPPKNAIKNKEMNLELTFKEPTVEEWLLTYKVKDKIAIKKLDNGLGEYVFDKKERLVIGMSDTSTEDKWLKPNMWLQASDKPSRLKNTTQPFDMNQWLKIPANIAACKVEMEKRIAALPKGEDLTLIGQKRKDFNDNVRKDLANEELKKRANLPPEKFAYRLVTDGLVIKQP